MWCSSSLTHRYTQTPTLTHTTLHTSGSVRFRKGRTGWRRAFSHVMGFVSVIQSHGIIRPGNEQTTRPLLAEQFNPSLPLNGKVWVAWSRDFTCCSLNGVLATSYRSHCDMTYTLYNRGRYSGKKARQGYNLSDFTSEISWGLFSNKSVKTLTVTQQRGGTAGQDFRSWFNHVPDLAVVWFIWRPGVKDHDSGRADQAVMWLDHILVGAVYSTWVSSSERENGKEAAGPPEWIHLLHIGVMHFLMDTHIRCTGTDGSFLWLQQFI